MPLWPDLIRVDFERPDDLHASDPSIAVTRCSEGVIYEAQSKSGSFYALCRQIASMGVPLQRQTVLYDHTGICAMVPKPLGYYAQWVCRESSDVPLHSRRWEPHKLHARHGDVELKKQLDAFWEEYCAARKAG